MICFPNCKINLGLFITEKRLDGYHNLETVFYPLAATGIITKDIPENEFTQVLNDVLEVVPAVAVPQLHLSGIEVKGEKDDNLVWKAYKLLEKEHPAKIPALDIYLHKATPMGAGLGGGSADGAYMLRLLNEYCKLNLSDRELAAYALQLGSDCPFFIYNTPQFATGRGEQMRPVNLDLSGYEIRVVCPGLHVSTREAFAHITPRPASFSLIDIGKLPLADWKNHIVNDFEAPIFNAHPELAAIKDRLYDQGAVYASMTGTGSAIYGIFNRI
jgi:4-diphosphocytidyl-2-C-methyl-D-erythritol kinase